MKPNTANGRLDDLWSPRWGDAKYLPVSKSGSLLDAELFPFA